MVRVGCEVPSEAKRVYNRCHLAFVELATVQELTSTASLSPVEANKGESLCSFVLSILTCGFLTST